MAEETKEEMPQVETVSGSSDDDEEEESTSREVPMEDAGEKPPQRLMITKMELENFKSYAGVKEIGPFHKCFSAVVGPNGSGKSNVIDAMLFVFGKRAKKLRLNKVRELIHKSDAVKDPTFARVSVFFQEIIDTGDGDEDYEIVPGTHRVVTRIAHINNSSTYKLDGKKCQFGDVAKYLGSKGIDLDNNRFLILQGEVEMISMMPPMGKNEGDEGLLEYLEDIIGSSQYVDETNLAAEKVEQLTEQRQEKLNRVKAAEKEKEHLEDAKKEAESLLQKDREIRRKRNVIYQIFLMKETKAMDKAVAEKETVAARLQEEKDKHDETVQRVQELEGALHKQTKVYNKIRDELEITKEEFTAFERRDIKLREEIKHAKEQLKKAKTKVTTATKKQEEATRKGQEAEESIPDLEQECAELTDQKTVQDEKLDQIQEDVKEITKELRTKLEAKTKELAPVKQELGTFKASLDTALHEVKLLEDSTTRAKERLASSEEELATLDEKEQSKKDDLTKSEESLEKARTRLKDVEKEMQGLADREASLAQRSRDLMARSEEAKAALQFGDNAKSPALKGILKAARKGGELAKAGVLGRLGDLCTIPAKYDVAVSTAVGFLDHIVVQTTAGAQRCVEYLRKYKLGRANFIALDKMKKGAHDVQVQTPEDAPRLFDLIAPGNFAVVPALFLAVQNTLVAPDLDAGSRWAFESGKRWRVVTLDGKLIGADGTMAGGGNRVARGRMRLANGGKQVNINPMDQASAEECKRLEQEAAQALELVQQCRKRIGELREESRTLTRSIKALEVAVPKLRMEVNGFDTSRKELTKLIPELRTKCELCDDDKAKLKELQKKVDKCKSDMSSCEKQASKLEAEVAKLQKSILDAGGSKLKKQQSACDKILNQLNDAEKALNAAKVAITTNKTAVTKAKKQIEAAEKQQSECTQSLEEKQEELEGLQEKAEKVSEAYEKVKEVEAERREELEKAKKEVQELKKSHAEAKCLEIELTGQVEAFDRQVTDSKSKKKHWKKEIGKLLKAEQEDDQFDFSDDEEEETDDMDEEEDTPGKGAGTGESDEEMEPAEGDRTEKEGKDKEDPESRSSLPVLSFSALEKYRTDSIKEDIEQLESERNSIAKNANMGAIEEYRKKEADYLARVGELNEITESRNASRKEYDELRRKRLEMFMNGFGKITLKLKEMYQMITLGGDAELELVDSLDPFSEGIVFSVRPPKKSWKNICNLSGGEKTLSSLALVFALHHYKPTPLYVMDEIDAALDFKNVSIIGNYIKERTKNAQFIIISLRNNMFELADRLVGIYKTNNCTKSVSIDPKAFAVACEQNGVRTPKRVLSEKSKNASVQRSTAGTKRQLSFAGDEENEAEKA
ncbi:Structural maintenance of chromosomes protein 4 (Fragment) [Seminavis robusta]|uniref:Structural maintenance of chromosomes protein n=1 Tax=Seminavis robusta TaxID=568900 RepID=A0A9N8HN16_9STRA